jgi:hypothetical protein
MPTILQRLRQTRDRVARIRDARLASSEQMRLTLETMQPIPRLIPFSELPEPCYMNTDDADLESFLRRNQLTDALETYLRSQAIRNLTA